MDVQDIITLISNVGFPIACCCVLFKQQNKLTDTLTTLSNTLAGIDKRLDAIEDKLSKGG